MKVKRIDLDDGEMPERVLVELSHDEAMLTAALLGRLDTAELNEVLPGGAALGADIYDGLAGSLFNRFYGDGVAEAVGMRRRQS